MGNVVCGYETYRAVRVAVAVIKCVWCRAVLRAKARRAVAPERLDAWKIDADAAVLARLRLVPTTVIGEGAAGATAGRTGPSGSDALAVGKRALAVAWTPVCVWIGSATVGPIRPICVVLALVERTHWLCRCSCMCWLSRRWRRRWCWSSIYWRCFIYNFPNMCRPH